MANKENSNIRQRTHENIDNVMDKTENMMENIDGYIKENPKKSLLIAAGIGAIIGIILTARRRR
jgi:ElaB/YqjD/DUF883 family membrane-anchored ribosome-binding protein